MAHPRAQSQSGFIGRKVAYNVKSQNSELHIMLQTKAGSIQATIRNKSKEVGFADSWKLGANSNTVTCGGSSLSVLMIWTNVEVIF